MIRYNLFMYIFYYFRSKFNRDLHPKTLIKCYTYYNNQIQIKYIPFLWLALTHFQIWRLSSNPRKMPWNSAKRMVCQYCLHQFLCLYPVRIVCLIINWHMHLHLSLWQGDLYFKVCLIFPQAGSITWRRRKSPNLNRNLTVPTLAGTRKLECLPSSVTGTQSVSIYIKL